MPYGKCERVLSLKHLPVEGKDFDPENEVFITEIFVTKMKLKPGKNAWYHIKNHCERVIEGLKNSDAVTELKYPHRFVVSCVDLANLLNYYDMEFSFDLPEEIRTSLAGEGRLTGLIRPKTWVFKGCKKTEEHPG